MASATEPRKGVVVIGAGVSGLTTAILLARRNAYRITVVAKHMPGDYDIEYASPWAGANFAPYVSLAGTQKAEWDRQTWAELERLTRGTPQAGIHFQEIRVHVRDCDKKTAVGDWLQELMKPEGPWFQDCVPDFKWLDKASCPDGYDSGFSYTTVCINTGLYLPWLASECLRAGVTIKRGVLSHIDEAFHMGADGENVDLVVNCCGLGATKLGGVEDKTMIPIRGQTVLVRNSSNGLMIECSGAKDSGDDELIYVMERAAGGGTILGGCYQRYNTDPKVDDDLTARILSRAAIACPALTGGRGPEALDVVQARVGLRPAREAGTRVEIEKLDSGRVVVHNYGHGGFGYQCSWGCSTEVAGLVDRALGQK